MNACYLFSFAEALTVRLSHMYINFWAKEGTIHIHILYLHPRSIKKRAFVCSGPHYSLAPDRGVHCTALRTHALKNPLYILINLMPYAARTYSLMNICVEVDYILLSLKFRRISDR